MLGRLVRSVVPLAAIVALVAPGTAVVPLVTHRGTASVDWLLAGNMVYETAAGGTRLFVLANDDAHLANGSMTTTGVTLVAQEFGAPAPAWMTGFDWATDVAATAAAVYVLNDDFPETAEHVYTLTKISAYAAANGAPLWTQTAPGRAIAVSPDGATLIVAGDAAVFGLDALTGEVLWGGSGYGTNGHHYGVSTIDFSPDGRTVYLSRHAYTTLHDVQAVLLGLDVATGEEVWRVEAPGNGMFVSVYLNGDGATVAGSYVQILPKVDGGFKSRAHVVIYAVPTESELIRFENHTVNFLNRAGGELYIKPSDGQDPWPKAVPMAAPHLWKRTTLDGPGTASRDGTLVFEIYSCSSTGWCGGGLQPWFSHAQKSWSPTLVAGSRERVLNVGSNLVTTGPSWFSYYVGNELFVEPGQFRVDFFQ